MKGDRDMRGKKELERQKPQEMKQRQSEGFRKDRD